MLQSKNSTSTIGGIYARVHGVGDVINHDNLRRHPAAFSVLLVVVGMSFPKEIVALPADVEDHFSSPLGMFWRFPPEPKAFSPELNRKVSVPATL